MTTAAPGATTPTDTTLATGTISGARRSLAERRPWRGPLRHYDIVKEAVIAVVVVTVLTVVLSLVLSSPDRHAVTLQQWSSAQPVGFVDTALTELDGSSSSAGYGEPYNRSSGSVQSLGPLSIQRLLGTRIPVTPAASFVIAPLHRLPPTPGLTAALARYSTASGQVQLAWDAATEAPLGKLDLGAGLPHLAAASMGPVPTLMASLLSMGRSGALDAALSSEAGMYTSDYTDSLLFLGDSATGQDDSYWNQIVTAEHLKGSQWGVMNETGSWPGQPWLWLYTLFYQVPPANSSGNADVLVLAAMVVLSLLLLAVPFVPGLRSIPSRLPLHRVIWRRYYRDHAL